LQSIDVFHQSCNRSVEGEGLYVANDALNRKVLHVVQFFFCGIRTNSKILDTNLRSNIFNILFIVGLSGLIIPVPFEAAFRFDTIIALAAAVLLFLFALPKKRLSRVTGIVMLLAYLAYFIWIL
jgi:cation:H+ antiporter